MRLLILFFITFIFVNAQTLIYEEFNTLDDWEPLTFDKIDKHSIYEVKDSVLIARSNASASGIRIKKVYDIYKYPILSFKWKVNNVYEKGDAKSKQGDDYPIRIYVMFEYNPDDASFFESIQYEFAKSIYGKYPPHSSINYIWANKKHDERIITSAYTSKAKMIVLNSGKANLDKWEEHSVNVLDDYKKAFGQNPPSNVSIAIMNDSDNTFESSTSYIDFIKIKTNE